MTAERNPLVRRTVDGNYSLEIEIDFTYGDLVEYDSINGKGRGTVESVIVPEDGGVYYTIMVEGPTEDYDSGIYPDEMKLIDRRCACGAYGTHSCTESESRSQTER